MPTTLELIAAQAKSLRAQLLRDGIRPVTSGDLAKVVELVEFLATQIIIEQEERRGNLK